MVCLLLVVLAVSVGCDKDPLIRIEREINRRGRCVVPGVGEVQAHSARWENGSLVLYGSNDPNEESGIRVALHPEMGSKGICRAKSVSIKRWYAPVEMLKFTFHQPTRLPPDMYVRSFNVPVFRHAWLRKWRFAIQDFLRRHWTQKPQSTGP